MANPPITVGELTDVPAPESPINAAFHQEVANRIVHRFATGPDLNAWAAANGSLGYVIADGVHYRRTAGVWSPIQTGDPHWVVYTPAAAAGGWNASTRTGRYMRIGDSVFVSVVCSGFGDSVLPVKISLPVAAVGEAVLAQCLFKYPGGVYNNAAAVILAGTVAQPFTFQSLDGTLDNRGYQRYNHPYVGPLSPDSVIFHALYPVA